MISVANIPTGTHGTLDPEINPSFLPTREVIPLRANQALVEVDCWDALDDFVPTALEFAAGRQISHPTRRY